MPSPTADVRMTLAANSAAAQMEVMTRKMKRMMSETGQGADQVNRKSKKASSSIGQWAGGIAKATLGLGAMIGIMKAGQLAMQMVNDQFQKGVDMSNMANQRQVPYQDKMKELLFEGVPGTVDMEAFVKSVDGKIKNANVRDKSALADLVIKSISTMSDPDPNNRVDFAIGMAESRRDAIGGPNQEALMQLVGVAAAAQVNFKDLGSTPRAQLGLMSQAKNASYVSDSLNFANNIAPIGNQLAQTFNYTQAEGLALGAALSTALGDQSGGNVLTLGNNIAAAIKEGSQRFGIDIESKGLLEQQEFLRGDSKQAKDFRKYVMGRFENGIGPLTDVEQLAFSDAQKNKELATHLRGKARTKYIGFQFFQPEGTADGDGSLNKLMRTAMKDMGVVMTSKNVVDVVATYKAAENAQMKKEDFSTTSSMFNAATRAMTDAESLESLAQKRRENIKADISNEGTGFDDFMKMTGQSSVDRMLNRMVTFYGTDDTLEAGLERKKAMLDNRSAELLNAQSFEFGDWSGDVLRTRMLHRVNKQGMTDRDIEAANFSQVREDAAKEIKTMRDAVVAELRALRLENQQRKKVEVDNLDAKPEAPDAAAMGK